MMANCGYQWRNSFHNLKDYEQGCPDCVGKAKYTYEGVYDFLFERNILLLESNYKNANAEIKLKCLVANCGHEWTGRFSDVKNKKCGCAKCGKRLKYTYEFVQKFLDGKCIELLSNSYANNKASLELKCKEDKCGYEWSTSFGHIIKTSSTCPMCARSKNEKLTGAYLAKLLSKIEIIPQYAIKTNLSSPKTIYVDFYFELNGIRHIVEYNGIQHYEYVELFHNNDMHAFEKQLKRDKWLYDYCRDSGIKLIVIDSRVCRDEKILNYLKEQMVPNVDFF
jgi:hypothetical protein